MKTNVLNTLFTVHSICAITLGIAGLLFTNWMGSLLWHTPLPESGLHNHLGRGWSASMIALGVLAWGARSFNEARTRRWMTLGFFLYYVLICVIVPFDQQVYQEWTMLGVMEFLGRLLLTFGYGFALIFNFEKLTIISLVSKLKIRIK